LKDPNLPLRSGNGRGQNIPEMEMVTVAQNKNGKVFFEKKKEWNGV